MQQRHRDIGRRGKGSNKGEGGAYRHWSTSALHSKPMTGSKLDASLNVGMIQRIHEDCEHI